MRSLDATSAVVVGAISRDLEGNEAKPGGVVHYAGLALAALGARVSVLTRVAAADAAVLLAPLRAEGVSVHVLPSGATTVCRNDYSGEVDQHQLLAVSDPIAASDLPENLRRADIVQLGPLHRDDLKPEIAAGLHGRVGLDIQGLVRERDGTRTRLAAPPDLVRFTRGVSVLKASEPELAVVSAGRSAVAFLRDHDLDELITTRGPRGATLTTAVGSVELEALPAECRFPAGAGDVFLAAYLLARARSFAPLEAAHAALRASAQQIERGRVRRAEADASGRESA